MCYTIHKGAGGLECRPALFAYWLMYSMAACQLSNFISLVPHLTYQYSPIGKGNHCAPFRLCRCTGFFVATLHFSCGLVTAIGCISSVSYTHLSYDAMIAVADCMGVSLDWLTGRSDVWKTSEQLLHEIYNKPL